MKGKLTKMTLKRVISLFLEHLTGTRYKPSYGEVIPLHFHSGKFTAVQPTA